MPAPTGGGRTKSSSVRLAILAVVSRVRCATLRDLGVAKQSLPKEERCKHSIVAEDIGIAPGNLSFQLQVFLGEAYKAYSSPSPI